MYWKILNFLKAHFNALSLFLGQSLVVVFGLLSTVIWARLGEPEEFGKYSLILSYISIVAVFPLSGLSTVLEISASRKLDGAFMRVVKTKFFAGIVCTFPFALFAIYHYFEDEYDMVLAILLVAIVFPFKVTVELWRSWLNGRGELIRFSANNVLLASTTLIVIYIGLLLSLPIYGTISFVIVTQVVLGCLFVFHIRKNLHNDRFDRSVFEYGRSLSFVFVINSVLLFDKFIINAFSESESIVAIYTVALAFSTLPKILFEVSLKILIPDLASMDNLVVAWDKVKLRVISFSVIFVLAGFLGYLTLELIIPLVFGSKYDQAKIYAVHFWFIACASVPSSYILALLKYNGYKSYLYGDSILNVASKFLPLVVLVPSYGIWGVVWGFYFSLGIQSIIRFLYFKRKVKVL